MSELSVVIVLISGLFAAFIWLQQLPLFKKRLCAICLAVSLSWIGLLAARLFDWFGDDVLIAILMGQSSLGIYYLWQRHSPKRWLVFRLPLLLTLIAGVHAIVSKQFDATAWLILVGIWIAVTELHGLRRQPAWRSRLQRLIECCRNW